MASEEIEKRGVDIRGAGEKRGKDSVELKIKKAEQISVERFDWKYVLRFL